MAPETSEPLSLTPTPGRQLSAYPTRRVDAHQHLFYEGDASEHLIFVERGWVKLYRTLPDGRHQIIGFATAGSILGFEAEEVHENGCEAITAATVRSIPTTRLMDLWQEDSDLPAFVLRQVGKQLRAAQAHQSAMCTPSAERKVASFLLAMCDLCGDRSSEFDLPMRRRDIADYLGLRLETISRKMGEFQRREWIAMPSLYRCRLVGMALKRLSDGADCQETAILAEGNARSLAGYRNAVRSTRAD